MIETYLLEQFVTVSRSATLRKAAEELHITQPALSRSMKKLEQELGVQLFIRENGRIALNKTGKLAARYAQKAIDANQQFVDKVRTYYRSQQTLVVGTCSPLPIERLRPLLETMAPKRPLAMKWEPTNSSSPGFATTPTSWPSSTNSRRGTAWPANDASGNTST